MVTMINIIPYQFSNSSYYVASPGRENLLYVVVTTSKSSSHKEFPAGHKNTLERGELHKAKQINKSDFTVFVLL